MKMEEVAGEVCQKSQPGNLPDPQGRTRNRQEEELTLLATKVVVTRAAVE